MTSTFKLVSSGLGAITLLGVLVACNPFAVVDDGHVGLVKEMGIAKEVRSPGFTTINPFTQDLIEVETRVRPVDFKDIEAASTEGQSVKLTGKLNFALQSADIVSLYKEVGHDFQGRILNSALASTAKAVMPEYKVNDILSKRASIEEAMVDRLNVRLKDYGIHVTAMFLENISFSPEYQAAIESKQKEAQNALKEEEITKQAIEKGRQAYEKALGDGKAIEALAKSQAEANRLLTASLTETVLRDKELSKWNGHCPLQSEVCAAGAGTLVNAGK